ncbi:hypothetical protein HHI36_011299, partial [Cryptolaemus montrouzieri]
MKKSGKSPGPMFLGNRPSEDNGEIAHLFAEFFSEVFTAHHIVSPNFNIPEVLDLTTVSFSSAELFDGINSLKPSKPCGPDGIPSILLRNC